MKKLLISITTLIICSTSFTKILVDVEENHTQIGEVVRSTHDHFEVHQQPQSVTADNMNKDLVTIPWSDFSTIDSVDIQFYSTEHQPKRQLTVNKNKDLYKNQIDAGQEFHMIHVDRSNTNSPIPKREVMTLPTEQHKPVMQNLFTGFWYHNDVPDNELKRLMTSGHTRSPNYQSLKKVIDDGKKVIPSMGVFQAIHSDQQLRERIRWYTNTFERIGWENISCIILRDEPYSKGFSKKQLEVILDEAYRQYRGCVTFMFTRATVLKRDLPDNISVIGVNLYPFFREDAPRGYLRIFNYQSFDNYFDRLLDAGRKEVIGAQFIITAQIFGTKEGVGGPPWRMPEPVTASWYMRSIADAPDVRGLLFWRYGNNNRWNGIGDSPELQRAWIEQLRR